MQVTLYSILGNLINHLNDNKIKKIKKSPMSLKNRRLIKEICSKGIYPEISHEKFMRCRMTKDKIKELEDDNFMDNADDCNIDIKDIDDQIISMPSSFIINGANNIMQDNGKKSYIKL